MSKPTKLVHALALPYEEPQWATLEPDQETAVLAFLLPLLKVIGDNRRRQKAGANAETQESGPCVSSISAAAVRSKGVSEADTHLLIGFNNTTRTLETLSRMRRPPFSSHGLEATESTVPTPQIAAVFVCRSSLPEIMTSTLPTLIATSAPKEARAKLIDLSVQAEKIIANALSLPRVGALALASGAPGIEGLSRHVLEQIKAIDIPWLEQIPEPLYQPTKVETITTNPKRLAKTRDMKQKANS